MNLTRMAQAGGCTLVKNRSASNDEDRSGDHRRNHARDSHARHRDRLRRFQPDGAKIRLPGIGAIEWIVGSSTTGPTSDTSTTHVASAFVASTATAEGASFGRLRSQVEA